MKDFLQVTHPVCFAAVEFGQLSHFFYEILFQYRTSPTIHQEVTAAAGEEVEQGCRHFQLVCDNVKDHSLF